MLKTGSFQLLCFFFLGIEEFQVMVIWMKNHSWVWMKGHHDAFSIYSFSDLIYSSDDSLVPNVHPIKCARCEYRFFYLFEDIDVMINFQFRTGLGLVFSTKIGELGGVIMKMPHYRYNFIHIGCVGLH